jgi:Zn ribbon nucleic-acid-binding protein
MPADANLVEVRLRQVECLKCGHRRAVRSDELRSAHDECPKCQYVGWAASAELTENTRRLIRERPLHRRRLYAVR